MTRGSFAQQLREELLEKIAADPSSWELCLKVSNLASFRQDGRSLRFATRHRALAELILKQLQQVYAYSAPYREGKRQYIIAIEAESTVQALKTASKQFARQLQEMQLNELSVESRQSFAQPILASLFLSCGAISSPAEAYSLDFSLRRAASADIFAQILTAFALPIGRIIHQAYHVIYLKDGQGLADFFLYSGAHQSLLRFEGLRVEKELLNQVNRIVNCDNANAGRLAHSSAKQRTAIQLIAQTQGLDSLPVDLQLTAKLRLAYPELSLAELGAKLYPPLGKSGVNHRLQRLLEIAAELKG